MHISELDFDYPEGLVATEKRRPSRVAWSEVDPKSETVLDPLEVSWAQFLSSFSSDDILVINQTRVRRARVLTGSGLEVLFLEALSENEWSVLCPARRWKKGAVESLPGGVEAELVERSLPQRLRVSAQLTSNYFEEHGELPLPPYIQKLRTSRRANERDAVDYQSVFARELGSLAAPTASLHFSEQDIDQLRARGVEILEIVLHVGLGTFLPVHADNLSEHQMHGEKYEVPRSTAQALKKGLQSGRRIWALGTTVTRALESWALEGFSEEAGMRETKLFIVPGFEFKVVRSLLTNFHQPRSTLLALVCAFAGRNQVLKTYDWCIQRNFRLFSYGDLTVWTLRR